MDAADTWAWVSLVFSGSAVPFGCLAAVCLFLQTRNAHINLRILDFIICTCYVLLPMFAVVNFSMNPFDPNKKIVLTFYSIFPPVIRYTGISICIERGIATIKAKIYENNPRFRLIIPVIFMFIAIMTTIEKFSINWSKLILFFATYLFNYFVL